MVQGQELPTAYVRAKFEGRSFIRLQNIGTFRCGALSDPVTLTFDLLTLKSVWESHVSWGTPRPFGFRVRADVHDIRETLEGHWFESRWGRSLRNNSGQVVHTYTKSYNLVPAKGQ